MTIAETLSEEISAGHYRPGDKLPTEAELSRRFGVTRHTVRHALAALAEAGTVHSRRGSGVYVSVVPADYPLGRRVRFHQNLLATGRTPSREILSRETRAASAEEAEALGLAPGDEVLVIEGLSLADGVEIAHFRSVFPAARLPGLMPHLERLNSITAALARVGLTDYTRASTRITAHVADAVMALRLRLQEGAPLLKSVAVNVDSRGIPIEYGTTWFAGDRVTLTVAPD